VPVGTWVYAILYNEKKEEEMKMLRIALLIGLTMGLAFSAVATDIEIGAKNFTEQYVAGNLMQILLEERGYDTTLRTGMSTTVMREALVSGAIDLVMEYTGNGWLLFPAGGNAYENETPMEMYQKARDYDAENGLAWLEPIWCNNTYAIAVTREFAEENDVYTLTEFAEYVNENEGNVPFCSTFEFYARPDGVLGWQLHYDFAFQPGAIKTVLPGLTFEPLIKGEVVATVVFGTDWVVAAQDWVALQDDQNFWPPYDLSPVIRQEVLDEYPELQGILLELVSAFPSDAAEARAEMTALNARVDSDLLEPEEAAREWLIEKGLI
jgi:osmoprotectant transport system substrate-binding protein